MDKENVEEVLNGVVRGLKEIIQKDKPRIRFWPPQLSNAGFAPTFHRLTALPEAEGEESRWVLLGGPASSGGKPILLGLAILADEPCSLGNLVVETTRWAEMVRIQTPDV